MTVGFNQRDAQRILQQIDMGNRSGLRNQALRSESTPRFVRNDSGGTVPEWAVMRVADVVEHEGRVKLAIVKPDDTPGVFVFNTGSEIAMDKTGTCQNGPIIKARYVDASGAPQNGDVWGVNGWALHKDGQKVLEVKIYGIAEPAPDRTLLGTVNGGGTGGAAAVFKPSGNSIPAMTNTWESSFILAERYKLVNGVWSNANEQAVQLWHTASLDFDSNWLVQAKQDVDGNWLIDVEDCPVARTDSDNDPGGPIGA